MNAGAEFKQSKFMAFLCVEEGRVTEVGPKFINMTGYTKEEILNKEIQYIMNVLLRLDTTIERLKEYSQSFFMFIKELELREVNISVKCQGAKTIVCFEEKEHVRFKEKGSYVEQLMRSNLSAMAVYSVPEFILLKANQKYFDYFEPPYNEARTCIGMKINKFIADWDTSEIENSLRQAIETGEVVQVKECKHVGRDKSITYWDSVVTPVFEDKKLKYIITNTTEVTEEVINREKSKQQNRAIKKQKDELETIVRNIYDGLYILNPDGSYKYFNESAAKLIYRTEMEKRHGDSMQLIKYYDMDGRQISRQDLPGGRILAGEKIENYILRAEGEMGTAFFSFNGYPIYDEQGVLEAAIVLVHDMTADINQQNELKTNQEKLLEAEKAEKTAIAKALQMKDEFLATITHEFKTPVTVISAALQAIESLYADEVSDNVRKHLKRIKINTLRQIRLVNNLLDFTRINTGHIKIEKCSKDLIALSGEIIESVDVFAKQKGVELTFSSDIESLEMAIDEEKYERILLNLLSNAIKFTPKGKKINIHISRSQRRVRIVVKDEGIGIPESKKEIIFERFGQVDSSLSRQAEGTGIGLSLTKAMVTVLEGKIKVESQENKGSTFTVTLPIKKLTHKEQTENKINTLDNNITQAAVIEFSDIYLE